MGLMLILTSYPSRSNALTPVSMTAVRSFMGARSNIRDALYQVVRAEAGPETRDGEVSCVHRPRYDRARARLAVTNRLAKDEARRIAANIAKLPESLQRPNAAR